MSFWKLDEEETTESVANYEAPSGGGNYLFADGTTLATVIEEMSWTSFNGGEEFINARLSVIAPETDADGVKISNRKLFVKLYVNEGNKERNKDPENAQKKIDRDSRLFKAMAVNAGGEILNLDHKPTNDDFARYMLMKPMLTRWGLWEMEINGEQKSGNFLQAVSKYDAAGIDAVGGAAKPSANKAQQSVASSVDSDEIPF